MVTKGNLRSKEDDVHNISTSVFVSNFPDYFGARDLWHSCKVYGHIVDTYIPDRRSKAGKRFGFVRFIKVLDVERLISNLCTIWVGRFKLQANVARFRREPMYKQKDNDKASGISKVHVANRESGDGAQRSAQSYAHVLNGYHGNKENSANIPTMVLDETCLNNEEYSLCLLGKVKEFASLSNLKLLLAKEGFLSIKIKYMGGYWVMIGFQNEETKNSFKTNVAVGSWFTQIIQAHNDFNIEERVAWVEIEGVPFKWWSKNTFRRIASRWGTLINGDDLDEDGHYSNRLCVCTKLKTILMESFKMVYRGKVYWVRAIEIPGWVPDFEEESDVESNDDSYVDEGQEIKPGHLINSEGESDVEAVPDTCFEDESNGKCMDENVVIHSEAQSDDPFGIYDVLNKKVNVEKNDSVVEESRKFPPGFTPTNVVDSPGNGQDDVLVNNSRRNDKEGGDEKPSWEKNARCADTFESTCSGHFKKSGAPRTGGSIIHLIDELVTVGQTMGYDMTGLAQKAKKDWVKELCVSNRVNFVSLQETKMENIDLWGSGLTYKNDHLNHAFVRGTWLPSGKKLLVISVYAPQELRDKKMLWDYLVMVICNWDGEVVAMGDFNEVRDCSERFGYLSDHRPILMRDIHNDYGSVPFKFFHYWWEIDGFDKLIEDSWNDANICDQNDYINLMKKLKFLKEKIRKWNVVYKESKNGGMRNLKADLHSLDAATDKGESSEMVSNRRMEVIRLMQDMEKVDNLEVAQKAKVKWAIEGDENSKYYHGPSLVKKEFLMHFKKKFEQPCRQDIRLEIDFKNRLSIDQKDDLESDVTNDEVRKAVWGLRVLDDLVNEVQSAFVTDRQILDGPFMLNEIVQWCKKRNKRAMIFKVDFEKAFDSVRWDFLEDIMRKFSFGDKWCMWIRSCLRSSRGSVIVNDAGLSKGIKLGSALHMSHLFYEDDAIFMGQWNQTNIDTITRVLEVFYRASGLRINMQKSKLMGIAVENVLVKQAASKIGCLVLKTPF
ncbi:RNA-directed DNA polymerase, eukaryota [Tanacetum coccineum]